MAEEQFATPVKGLKPRWVLAIAVGFGLAAAALNWIYMGQLSKKTMRLLKVKGPGSIQAGTPVTRDMFSEVTVSGEIAEMRDVVVDSDSFGAFEQQPVAETLKPGYLLLTRSFSVTGAGGFRDSIPQNQIALSLNIDREAEAVGYNVKPDDLVQVWGEIGGEAVIIAKNVCVRAVGDAYSIPTETNREGRYRSVTVFLPDVEQDTGNFLSNVVLAGNKIRLALKGPCAAGIAPQISPKHDIRPTTTVTTPTVTKNQQPQAEP